MDAGIKHQRESSKYNETLLLDLRGQLEFYMSNNNLLHDKFLRSELWTQSKVKPKHCIKLTTFLGFNKVKAILNRYSLPARLEPSNQRAKVVILAEEAAKLA